MDNKTLILKEFEKLKGQFVITQSWSIERLIAIGEDEWDYYYVTFDGRKLTWNTCVGRLIPLKGYLRNKDYKEFIRLAKINHHDQVTVFGNTEPEKLKEFCDKYKKDLTTLEETSKFISEICWELN